MTGAEQNGEDAATGLPEDIASIVWDERRLEALHRIGFFEPEGDADIDVIARLAGNIMDCPIALVSLVDADRQWFAGCVGLSTRETPVEHSFCAHTIADGKDGTFVVEDATKDNRFAANPLVTGEPFICFYAGVPIEVEGERIGTLCVISPHPRRRPDPGEEVRLRELATIAGTALRLKAAERERNRLDSAISLETARHALALRASGIVSWVWDIRTGSIEGSPRLAELFGLPGGEPVTAEAVIARIHFEDRPAVQESLQRALHERKEYSSEFRVGETGRWLYGHGKILERDSYGNPVKVAGVNLDITERKAAEQALRESEGFVRRVLDNLFTFVGVLKPDGTLIEANRAPIEAAGITREDVIGKKVWDCHWFQHSEEERVRLRAAIARALTGETVRYDMEVTMRGGELMWIDFQLSPMRNENGDISHIIPSGIELTARKEAERDSERLTAVIEATPDFIAIFDREGRIGYFNASAAKMAGSDGKPDPLDMNIFDFLTPQARQRVHDEALPAAVAQGTWAGEVELLTASGESVPVSQVILSHRKGDGTVDFFATLARDISERKRAEMRQTLLLRELAHRVKNTLAVIQSITRQTLRATSDPAAFVEAFQGRIASLAASHTLLTDGDWNGAGLEQIIQSQVHPLIPDDKTRLTAEGPEIILPAETATQLGLVFHELGTNALKHGAFSVRSGRVDVSWSRERDRVLIEWRETGVEASMEKPLMRGFGSKLIEMSVEDYRASRGKDGMEVRFAVRLGALAGAGQ